MSKRFISLILCLCMLCMGTIALADDTPAPVTTDVVDLDSAPDHDPAEADNMGDLGKGYSTDITAIAENDTETVTPIKYSVEIVWGDMQFAWGYVYTEEEIWDPETHTYKTVTIGDDGFNGTKDWYMVNNDEGDALKNAGAVAMDLTTQDAVLVFNHSNAPVDAKIDIDNSANTDAINAAGIDASFNVASTKAPNKNTNTGAYQLNYGTEGKPFADDGTSIMGTISLTKPEGQDAIDALEAALGATDENPTAKVVAKLTVTISKSTMEKQETTPNKLENKDSTT